MAGVLRTLDGPAAHAPRRASILLDRDSITSTAELSYRMTAIFPKIPDLIMNLRPKNFSLTACGLAPMLPPGSGWTRSIMGSFAALNKRAFDAQEELCVARA